MPPLAIRMLRRSALGVRQASTSASASGAATLKRTPLYDLHTSMKAKMVPFAGYSMPVLYQDLGLAESHQWTRGKASAFDVSHMCQFTISGAGATDFLERLLPSGLRELQPGHSTLSVLLNEQGGIIDDTIVTKWAEDEFYIVTNAACREKDLAHIDAQLRLFDGPHRPRLTLLNHMALLAVQGPDAATALAPLVRDGALDDLKFGQSRHIDLCGVKAHAARGGYTGEDGFELSIPASEADRITRTLLDTTKAGAEVRMAGLGARDSLRLEAGMCLYGHDISTETTPPMAALGWIVGKDRRSPDATPEFKGQSVILEQLASPKKMTQRRVGFIVEKGPAAREGADIIDPDSNEVIGKITSGCPAPSMGGQNIAMGLIKNGFHKKGTPVAVKVRKGTRKAEVAKLPFVESKFYRPDLKGKGKAEAVKEGGAGAV